MWSVCLLTLAIASAVVEASAGKSYTLTSSGASDVNALIQLTVGVEQQETTNRSSTESTPKPSRNGKRLDPRVELKHMRQILDKLIETACDADLEALWYDLSYYDPAQIMKRYLAPSLHGQCSGQSVLLTPRHDPDMMSHLGRAARQHPMTGGSAGGALAYGAFVPTPVIWDGATSVNSWSASPLVRSPSLTGTQYKVSRGDRGDPDRPDLGGLEAFLPKLDYPEDFDIFDPSTWGNITVEDLDVFGVLTGPGAMIDLGDLGFPMGSSNNTNSSGINASENGTASPTLGLPPLTIEDVFGVVQQDEFHMTYVHVIGLVGTVLLLALGLYLLAYSPLNGYNVEINKTTGEVSPTAMKNHIISVCLPFWFPVDKTNMAKTKFQGCIDVVSLLLSSAALGFLWQMLELKLVIYVEPDLFDDMKKAGMGIDVYFGKAMMYISCFGCACWPLCYMSMRSQLRGRETQHLVFWFFLAMSFKDLWGSIPASYIGRGMAMWIPGRLADTYWHYQRTYVVYQTISMFITSTVSLFLSTYINIIWRKYETKRYMKLWLSKRAYYHLNTNSGVYGRVDNPDLRIQSDVEIMTSSVVAFFFGLLTSIINAFMTLQIIWLLAPKWTIYGLLLTGVGMLVTLWFTWRFARLAYEGEMFGGDWRHALMNVRNNAEGIAFYGGEEAEYDRISYRFEKNIDNGIRNMYLSFAQSLYTNVWAVVVSMIPQIFMLQGFFRAKVDFGGYQQMAGAYGSYTSTCDLLDNRTQSIVSLATAVSRLGTLQESIDQIGSIDPTEGDEEYIITKFVDTPTFKATNVSVDAPNRNIRLVRDLSFELGGPGQPRRLLIVGRSGVGKSSLLRGLTGVWREGTGTVEMPELSQCIFLPQNPYMPLGSLRDQLTYPYVSSHVFNAKTDVNIFSMLNSKDIYQPDEGLDKRIMKLLNDLGMGDLPDRFENGLDHIDDWNRVFSKGEQQRIAVLRGMLNELSLVVLDEATSALSRYDEENIYTHYKKLDIPVISVGHRESLVKYHDAVLELKPKGGYQWWHNPQEYLAHMSKTDQDDEAEYTRE